MKKTIYIYITFFFSFIFSFKSQAQSIIIRGHVYDLHSQEALGGIQVLSQDSKDSTTTDDKGFFSLPIKQEGTHIIFSGLGYINQKLILDTSIQDHRVFLEPGQISLNEVIVKSFNSHKKNKYTPGAISTISQARIRQGNEVSLQSAFNSVPGIKMDQSTLSEARISIRGSGVRSPWGVRNIKIYVNDIPVTETDGTSRLEAIDVNDLSGVEIIKGPASSIYGAGTTGGIINFQLQRAPQGENSIEASALTGAYGLRRFATTYRNGTQKMNSYLSYGQQDFEGYQQHSNDFRRFLVGNFLFYPSDNRRITLLINRTTQHSQIPGALTQEQVEEDRKQANAGNLNKEAGRYQTWTRIGIGQQYSIQNNLKNSTSLFTYFYDIDHPLAFAYIRNFYQSYGGRTYFTYSPNLKKLKTHFTLGAEFNQAKTKGTQYENEGGKEGDIRSNIDYRNTLYSLFYQSETRLSDKTTLTLGLSYNGLRYDVSDYLQPSRSGIKNFKGELSPRVALSHDFGDFLTLHGSVSTGFAPPTTSEIQNADGSINRNIGAEKAINYEVNAKGNILGSRLAYNLALFKMDMKGELIAQTVAQGITIYNNAGKTSHNGAELSLAYPMLSQNKEKWVHSFSPYAAVTYSNFHFEDYKLKNAENEVDVVFDGNELTGTSPWIVYVGFDLEIKNGFYLNTHYYFTDRTPLNDENTVYNPSYQFINSKIGYKTKITKYLSADVFTGLDNILNEKYSSLTSLNAVGYGGGSPAYFTPSPERNAYAGARIKFNF